MLGFAQPAISDVLEDTPELVLAAGDKGNVLNIDRQGTPQEAAKVGYRVRQSVRLVIAAVEGDEDSEVVSSRRHFDRGSREFRANLEIMGRHHPAQQLSFQAIVLPDRNHSRLYPSQGTRCRRPKPGGGVMSAP